jgi:phosphoribosylformylglycinamidine cyclo-ligase
MRVIHEAAEATDQDMLRTFNMGTGIAAVVSAGSVGAIQEHLTRHGCESYLIGEIVASTEEGKIGFKGSLHW